MSSYTESQGYPAAIGAALDVLVTMGYLTGPDPVTGTDGLTDGLILALVDQAGYSLSAQSRIAAVMGIDPLPVVRS